MKMLLLFALLLTLDACQRSESTSGRAIPADLQAFLTIEGMSPVGTKLPSAKAVSCPQLVEGDVRALAERSGFGPVADVARSVDNSIQNNSGPAPTTG